MATLTRARSEHEIVTPATIMTNYLESSIPTPFPRERLVDVDDVQFVPSQPSESSERQASSSVTTEIMPSIAFVERSCLMTLNNLLSVPSKWNPIVPDRRHSMPNTPHTASTSTEAESSSSALQTLVSNLRTRDFGDEMVEMAASDNDSDLIHELNSRVDGLSSSLLAEDAKLAKSLVSLLSYLHRLSILFASSRGKGHHQQYSPPLQTSVSDNIFDTLKRQLSDLQVERRRDILPPGSPPVLAVETALLWSRIDEELESVLVLCKERTTADHLPPQYDRADYEFDTPPEYDYQANMSLYDSKETSSHAPQSPTLTTSMNEKMRLDFEAVTMAIDRLYLVAPQLHNQRVELKSSKLAQMEKASREGGQTRGKGKQKQSEPDIRELENIFELLGKATDRAMKDQSVILDGGMKSRLERARQRDEAKREAFVDQLAQHSSAGRLHSQDAILLPPRVKNPEAMLTLPEFIRESVPESLRQYDPDTMMSLPEFVRENPPSHLLAPSIGPSASMPLTASAGGTLRRLASATKKNRDRSMSAPSPLSWLRHSASRSALSESKLKVPSRSPTPKVDFEVSYIAENHENLNHILVFVSVNGVVAGTDVEAEVSPSLENSSFGSNRLIIKCGSQTSMPLALPGHVHCGKKEMRAQSGHYEIKLTTIPSTTPSPQPAPLLDAVQLSDWNPTTFVCDSCSLPVVHSSKISQYRDLPSEHWQELVDAWMCHPDQKLHDQVVQSGSKGFWPESGQALVGGSYILFEESAVSKTNIHAHHSLKGDKDWQPVLCLCGAALGRCQQAPPNTDRSVVYRLLKYAIRPVSPTAEPVKVPLSAFIVEDMIEFVHAHASYRFVVLDEEEEKPRILMWLFKPNIQLAYTARTHYSLPKSANMHAAKVLFKLVGPSEERTDLKSILNKYPGFPQAEYLFYSMNVCRRIAGYLNESNRTYPDSMRTMTDLEVGWLRRF